MHLEHVPLLDVQRRLYDLPRGGERFRRYVATLTGGGDDLELPLTLMNPMGKAHVPALLDALLDAGAEDEGAAAVAVAAPRLAAIDGHLRTAIVVADDAAGGWTNRYLTETRHRFDPKNAEVKRGWAVALAWTGDPVPARREVRRAVLAAIYRTLHVRRFGWPRTLGEMMLQEGRAAVFAGDGAPTLDGEELSRVRAIVDRHRSRRHFPTCFACLYGDAAAESVGYDPLGLPARAGYALARAEARRAGSSPEEALAGDG